MAALPLQVDPTLEAMKVAMQEEAGAELPRAYLGMSGIANECMRQSWYQWRWWSEVEFDADTLARFADGHYSEDLTASRLRKVDGISLTTHTPEGKQIGFSDYGGHFRGHMDGLILGLHQAPKTKHVWEHKCVNETKFKKLNQLKESEGEKNALEKWDAVYYGQAVLYMEYSELDRHYLTVATAGSREITSARTEKNKEHAQHLIAKAGEIICAEQPPARAFKDASFYKCKWCAFSDNCHYNKPPQKTCRSCRYCTPIDEGKWYCDKWGAAVPTVEDQLKGCEAWTSLA